MTYGYWLEKSRRAWKDALTTADKQWSATQEGIDARIRELFGEDSSITDLVKRNPDVLRKKAIGANAGLNDLRALATIPVNWAINLFKKAQ